MKQSFCTPDTKPITLSSSSGTNESSAGLLRCSYKKAAEETVTLSSETERCPVTWLHGKINKKNSRVRLDYNEKSTPSPKSKVLSWMSDNVKLQNCARHVRQSIPLTETHLDTLTSASAAVAKCDNVEEKKSSILVRQDYQKDDSANLEEVALLEFLRSKSTERIIHKNSMDISPRSKSLERDPENEKTKQNSIFKDFLMEIDDDRSMESAKNKTAARNETNNVDENDVDLQANVTVQKRKFSNEDIPLSPESQKKKELYSYLQLMNMNPVNDKKIVLIQNRRSMRVRNHILMSEKKKLESKLRSESSSFENDNENLSRKSFSQLGLNVASTNEDRAGIFPVPAKSLPNDCDDFDKDMLTFLDKEKIAVDKDKSSKVVKNGSVTKVDKQKKIKNKIKRRDMPSRNKQKLVQYLHMQKNKNLRSGGTLKNVELKLVLFRSKHKERAIKRLIRKRKRRVNKEVLNPKPCVEEDKALVNDATHAELNMVLEEVIKSTSLQSSALSSMSERLVLKEVIKSTPPPESSAFSSSSKQSILKNVIRSASPESISSPESLVLKTGNKSTFPKGIHSVPEQPVAKNVSKSSFNKSINSSADSPCVKNANKSNLNYLPKQPVVKNIIKSVSLRRINSVPNQTVVKNVIKSTSQKSINSLPEQPIIRDVIKSTSQKSITAVSEQLVAKNIIKPPSQRNISSSPEHPVVKNVIKSTSQKSITAVPEQPVAKNIVKSQPQKNTSSFPEHPVVKNVIKSTSQKSVTALPEQPVAKNIIKSPSQRNISSFPECPVVKNVIKSTSQKSITSLPEESVVRNITKSASQKSINSSPEQSVAKNIKSASQKHINTPLKSLITKKAVKLLSIKSHALNSFEEPASKKIKSTSAKSSVSNSSAERPIIKNVIKPTFAKTITLNSTPEQSVVKKVKPSLKVGSSTKSASPEQLASENVIESTSHNSNILNSPLVRALENIIKSTTVVSTTLNSSKRSIATNAPEEDGELFSPFCGFETHSEAENETKKLDNICMNLFNRIFVGPDVSETVETTEAPQQDKNSSLSTSNGDSSYTPPDSNTPESTDHNYAGDWNRRDRSESPDIIEIADEKPEVFNIDEISSTNCEYVPLNVNVEVRSLHRNLTQTKRKHFLNNLDTSEECNQQTWEADTLQTAQKVQKTSKPNNHSILIVENRGAILNAFYVDFNLIIVQELLVSFWTQSALGNVLGAQNLWISKGSVQRLVLDQGCIHRKSKETIISLDNSVAYIELWTKEHKSDKRERPVSDVFVTIYFCRHRKNSPDKKVLQLENIKGFADDVQYIVLTNTRNIVVSWSGFCGEAKTTLIHCYNLESDFQTVLSIKEMKSISHYVSSLHNIEDCDSLILGYGENKMTLWNVDYGYVVATIDLLQTRPPPTMLWAKCDRGFLFALQLFDDGKIRLVAINGINHSWKCLQVYKPPQNYKRLCGVCIENEILVAFYVNGILSWNVQTGQLILEEVCNEACFLPTGKFVIINVKEQIVVKHVLSYLVMCDV